MSKSVLWVWLMSTGSWATIALMVIAPIVIIGGLFVYAAIKESLKQGKPVIDPAEAMPKITATERD